MIEIWAFAATILAGGFLLSTWLLNRRLKHYKKQLYQIHRTWPHTATLKMGGQ